MLDILRRNSRHWVVMLLIGVIIIGLSLFFGYTGDRTGPTTWAAKVGGESIRMADFVNRYRNIVESYRRSLGSDFDESILEQLDIRLQILSNMVSERLIAKEAKISGIGVSRKELMDSIAEIPYLQQDGRFSMDYYRGMLAYNRMSASEFEEMQERDLLRERMSSIVMSSYKASDEDIINAYIVNNQRIRLSFIKIDHELTIEDEELDHESIQALLDTEEGRQRARDYYIDNSINYLDPEDPSRLKSFEELKYDIARMLLKEDLSMKRSYELLIDALKADSIQQSSRLIGIPIKRTEEFTRKANNINEVPGSAISDVLWAFSIEPGVLYSRRIGPFTYIFSTEGADKVNIDPASREFRNFKRDYLEGRGRTTFISYVDDLHRKWARKIKYSPAIIQGR